MAFQKTDQGYDVTATKRVDPPGANGRLASEISAASVPLWISEIQTSFSMAGSTGQSVRTRSFFPRNFVQPSFMVFCQCANQEIYSRTIEFIRTTQVSFDPSVNLRLYNAGAKVNRSIKGAHFGNAAQGYIKSVKRSHERFIYAPDLQFTFVVERFLGPTNPLANWRDQGNAHPSSLQSWADIIMKHKSGLARDPDTTISSDAVANPVLAPGPGGSGPRPT